MDAKISDPVSKPSRTFRWCPGASRTPLALTPVEALLAPSGLTWLYPETSNSDLQVPQTDPSIQTPKSHKVKLKALNDLQKPSGHLGVEGLWLPIRLEGTREPGAPFKTRTIEGGCMDRGRCFGTIKVSTITV